jgi:hypothetical protein
MEDVVTELLFTSLWKSRCIKLKRMSLDHKSVLLGEITDSCSLKVFIPSKFLICVYSFPRVDFRQKQKEKNNSLLQPHLVSDEYKNAF